MQRIITLSIYSDKEESNLFLTRPMVDLYQERLTRHCRMKYRDQYVTLEVHSGDFLLINFYLLESLILLSGIYNAVKPK